MGVKGRQTGLNAGSSTAGSEEHERLGEGDPDWCIVEEVEVPDRERHQDNSLFLLSRGDLKETCGCLQELETMTWLRL